MLGEAVQLAVGGLGPGERLAERRRELAEHADRGGLGRPVPVGRLSRRDQRPGVLGGRGLVRGQVGRGDDVGELLGTYGRARDDADAAPGDRDHGELGRARHAVGGQGVAGETEVRRGPLVDDHDAVVRLAEGKGTLDGLLRSHFPPS